MSFLATPMSAFLMGLMGAGHCALMCGGLVGIASFGGHGSETSRGSRPPIGAIVASCAGRIVSYSVAGAVAGAVGGGLTSIVAVDGLPWMMRVLAGALMIMVGLNLAGIRRATVPIAWLGHFLWRRLSTPVLRNLSVRPSFQPLVFGFVWGWLPCGLVYAAMALAGTSGSAAAGGMTMTAFGLGTVPTFLALGWTGTLAVRFAYSKWVRVSAAMAMLALGSFQMTTAGRAFLSAHAVPACHHTM